MKIAVIQASSQKEKNTLLYESVKEIVIPKGHEVINFGVFLDETKVYSYVQTAVCISALLESKVVDFVVTGCSSGQGMMLACNSLPGVICGLAENPSDAYLFGRINDGNAISFPLGLNFGWCGELNLRYMLEKLFEGEMGGGYPIQDAERKQKDTKQVKWLNGVCKHAFGEVLPVLEEELLCGLLERKCVLEYIMCNSKQERLKKQLKAFSDR